MMKFARHIALSLMAIASACVGIGYCIVEPMARIVRLRVESMACGVQQLKRELIHQFNAPAMAMTGVGCGLTPESHGFRQSSACSIGAEERTALSI